MLSRAKQITDQLLKKKDHSDENNESVKQMATEIHSMIGQIAKQNGDLENSVKFYSKAGLLNFRIDYFVAKLSEGTRFDFKSQKFLT